MNNVSNISDVQALNFDPADCAGGEEKSAIVAAMLNLALGLDSEGTHVGVVLDDIEREWNLAIVGPGICHPMPGMSIPVVVMTVTNWLAN